MKLCDICGKDIDRLESEKLADPFVFSLAQAIGISIEPPDSDGTGYFERQDGPFFGKKYNCCRECWFRSMGFKP